MITTVGVADTKLRRDELLCSTAVVDLVGRAIKLVTLGVSNIETAVMLVLTTTREVSCVAVTKLIIVVLFSTTTATDVVLLSKAVVKLLAAFVLTAEITVDVGDMKMSGDEVTTCAASVDLILLACIVETLLCKISEEVLRLVSVADVTSTVEASTILSPVLDGLLISTALLDEAVTVATGATVLDCRGPNQFTQIIVLILDVLFY